MANNESTLNTLSTIIMIVMIAIIILAVVLAIIIFFSSKSKKKNKNNSSTDINTKESKIKSFAVESVMDFMEFDKIEDNMIVQKNGSKYIMVLECQGVNYDLMSEMEKNAVEAGFIQFLNALR